MDRDSLGRKKRGPKKKKETKKKEKEKEGKPVKAKKRKKIVSFSIIMVHLPPYILMTRHSISFA